MIIKTYVMDFSFLSIYMTVHEYANII